MFKTGDIVRIVNAGSDYSITVDGTIGEIMSTPSYRGEQRFKIISLPTTRNRSYIGEEFPIKINCMELVEKYVTIPHAHVISKIKVLQDRFDKRKAALKKQKSTYVYLDEAIPF